MATPDYNTWTQWTKYQMDGTATATTSTAITPTTAWRVWSAEYQTSGATTTWYQWTTGSTTTTASVTDPVFAYWVDKVTGQRVPLTTPVYRMYEHQPVQQTPEEVAEARRQLEARQAEQRAAAEARAAKLKAVNDRAERTLRDHLTPEQERAWIENRHIFVTSQSGRRFKIRHGVTHNIKELDAQGREIRELCVHLNYGANCPVADHVLAQVLGLKFNEAALLKKANIWDVTQPARPIVQRSS